MQGQSGYYYYDVLEKQHTALQKCCFHVSSTTQEHRKKRGGGKSIQAKNLKMKAQHNHFQQFLCLLCFSGYFMMQNSKGCVVANEKWKNKSEFRLLKDLESDNNTLSVSAQV